YVTARITRPIFRLRNQVDRIAGGDFVPVTVTPRNDEIRDLSMAINHMVQMLAQYERQVRREEQLRTLGRLGGGMAHQVRNALTGCRMALELHRADCSMADDETLWVALRQIDLLEGSVK